MAHLQLSEGSIPSSPAAGKRIIFASTDGIYGLDSAGGTTLFGAGGGGGGGGIAAAAGTQTATSGTVVFSNSNNFTFGMSGSTRITASFSESTHSHATAAYSGSNGSFTANTLSFGNLNGLSFYTSNGSIVGSYTDGGGGGGGIAAAAGTQTATSGTIVFANSNNFTFGMSASSQITASFSESTHSHSTAPSAIAAGTQTATSGTIVFANSNNITFGMSGSSQITASFSQSVQTQASGAIAGSGFTSTTTAGTAVAGTHNSAGLSMAFPVMLTTARASNDAIGLATAQSNVTWTVNSAGLSLDARGYAGTGTTFGGTNVSASVTLNSAGLVLSLSGAAGGGGGGGIAASAGTQLATSGTIVFANSNDFTFGMSGSSQITASFSQSTHTHATFVGALAAGTQTATSGTIAFANSNGLTFGMSGSSQITASHNGLTSQTAQTQSNIQGIIVSNTTYRTGDVSFSNANGITFGSSAGQAITASHNGLTSQSNQAFSAAGGSSAFQTLGFSDTNGVSFSNSGGSVVATVRTDYASSVHAHNATFFATSNTTQSSSGTVNISSIVFAGAGIASVGVTNGSVVISVPSGGGAGDGGNILAAGTRTAGSNSTLLFSNANGVTFGLDAVAGSVMTASVVAPGTMGGAELFQLNNASVFSTPGLNSIYFQKFINASDISFNNFERRASFSSVSSAASQQAAHTFDYGLYIRNTGASSSEYTLAASSRFFFQASYSSNLSGGFTLSQGAASLTSSSAGTALFSQLTGFIHLYLPFTSTITEGGQYAIAMRMSSATTGGTSPMRIGLKELTNYATLSIGKISPTSFTSSNASHLGDWAQGVWSATSSNLPNTLQLSGFTNAVSQARMYLQFDA
jgi:hypothetical protein